MITRDCHSAPEPWLSPWELSDAIGQMRELRALVAAGEVVDAGRLDALARADDILERAFQDTAGLVADRTGLGALPQLVAADLHDAPDGRPSPWEMARCIEAARVTVATASADRLDAEIARVANLAWRALLCCAAFSE